MHRILFLFFLMFATLISCNSDIKPNISAQKKIDYIIDRINSNKVTDSQSTQSLDSIADVLKRAPNDYITRENYFRIASAYSYLGNKDQHLKISVYLKSLSEKKSDTLNLIRSYYNIATHYYTIPDFDSAYYNFTKAEKLCLKSKNKELLSYILLSKANILSCEKDFVGSETLVVRALKATTDNRLIYECFLTLGNNLYGLSNYDGSLSYYNKSYFKTPDLAEDPQYLLLKAQALNCIGKIYEMKGDHKSAIATYKKALNLGSVDEISPTIYSYILNNLAYSKFKSGDAYGSKTMFNNVIKICDSINNVPTHISCNLHLSEYYLETRDTLKAFKCSDTARILAHENKIYEDELSALNMLIKTDKFKITQYYDRYKTLSDSLLIAERTSRNKFARVEYETQEIEDRVNIVAEERDIISRQRWLILGLSASVIFIIALLYLNRMQGSRNKELLFMQQQQKSNEEIYQLILSQEEKIGEGKRIEKRRISKELHDGVMGRLNSIRLNLFILSKKTDAETIDKCLMHINEIQNIEKDIRNIAHDLNSNLFSESISFQSTVENLFLTVENHSDVNFRLKIDDHIDWSVIGSNYKMVIYRILQESLQNMYKYANAKNFSVYITTENHVLRVEISDDGIGFDLSKKMGGIGLKNMEERVKDLNGQINISSGRGHGTTINFSLPI